MKDQLSCSALARLCKLDRRTVSNRLASVAATAGPKGAPLYALGDALPVLCRADTPETEIEQSLSGSRLMPWS